MTPIVKEIRRAGKTWTVGQRVVVPHLNHYEGLITSLWPAVGNTPARAHVKGEGEQHIRVATLCKLKAVV